VGEVGDPGLGSGENLTGLGEEDILSDGGNERSRGNLYACEIRRLPHRLQQLSYIWC
jgi:hypothetical protein